MTGYSRNLRSRIVMVLLLGLLLLSLAPVASADDDAPTVAYLRFGQSPSVALTDKAILDMLEVYGYISADERAVLDGNSDLHGENINILYRDAGFDLATATLMVEDAMDEGADVLLTISTEVGLIAGAATQAMEDPPAMIFAILTAPYYTGLAAAPCLKPANLTGTQMDIDFAQFDEVRNAQSPGLGTLGIIMNADDPAQALTLQVMNAYAAASGFKVATASVVNAADYALATESLLDRGADALLLPPRTGSSAGLAAVVDTAYGIPVYSVMLTDIFSGIQIGSGFQGWYSEGLIAAQMLIGHLRGEIDIATTAINASPGFSVAVNLDAAEATGVTITDELLALASFVIEGGAGMGEEFEIPGVNTFLEEMSLEERMAADAEFLAGLQCTPEMIAEQQAALDAEA